MGKIAETKNAGMTGTDNAAARRVRMAAKDRERQILDGAIAYFAEMGFDGGLRDLAKRLGITHQNLFRYFPTKEALIERVYEEVYLNRWQQHWELLLRRPDASLEERLNAFYNAYLPAIFQYDWVRIFFFAGMRDVGITQRYLNLIQAKVVEPIALEIRLLAGVSSAEKLTNEELEIVWGLHGELVYLGIRKWIYGMETPQDLKPVVAAIIAVFLKGAPQTRRELAKQKTEQAVSLPL